METLVVTKERLYLFDTTLRDGNQSQGVDFSVEDKRTLAHALDTLRRRKADADADSDAAQLALLADALSNYCES